MNEKFILNHRYNFKNISVTDWGEIYWSHNIRSSLRRSKVFLKTLRTWKWISVYTHTVD